MYYYLVQSEKKIYSSHQQSLQIAMLQVVFLSEQTHNSVKKSVESLAIENWVHIFFMFLRPDFARIWCSTVLCTAVVSFSVAKYFIKWAKCLQPCLLTGGHQTQQHIAFVFCNIENTTQHSIFTWYGSTYPAKPILKSPPSFSYGFSWWYDMNWHLSFCLAPNFSPPLSAP